MGGHTFNDTKIPLFITTTEYVTGDQVMITDSDLFQAVRASLVLPLIFSPIRCEDRLLTDGFLSDPMPVRAAVQNGADVILAMGFKSMPSMKFDSFSDYLLHLAGIMSNNLLEASYAFYELANLSKVIAIVPEFERESKCSIPTWYRRSCASVKRRLKKSFQV